MGEVIEVNFKEKRVVEKYTITKKVCGLCGHMVTNDTRLTDNTPYVPLSYVKGHCVCKDCLVELATLVKQEGWTND